MRFIKSVKCIGLELITVQKLPKLTEVNFKEFHVGLNGTQVQGFYHWVCARLSLIFFFFERTSPANETQRIYLRQLLDGLQVLQISGCAHECVHACPTAARSVPAAPLVGWLVGLPTTLKCTSSPAVHLTVCVHLKGSRWGSLGGNPGPLYVCDYAVYTARLVQTALCTRPAINLSRRRTEDHCRLLYPNRSVLRCLSSASTLTRSYLAQGQNTRAGRKRSKWRGVLEKLLSTDLILA